MYEQAYERYRHIPDVLKQLPNWCIAGTDKDPYKCTPSGIFRASNKKPGDWTTFDKAIENMVTTGAPYIGFCLNYTDGLTCIDLDVKNHTNAPGEPNKWTTQEAIDRYVKMVNTFDSYTEISSSGLGLHIWVKGSIGLGARRDGVEVYSQERFIICTGNVYVNKPIEQRDDWLNMLVTEIRRAGGGRETELEEIEPVDSDADIFDRAANAANADKFLSLFNGSWEGEYTSQSEADLALMSMFTFYSKSNSQCRRMFRVSQLGQREKANKNDYYLNHTLEIIRARQQRESVIDAHGEEMARELVRKLQGQTGQENQLAANVLSQTKIEEVEGTIDWPPGIAGHIAHYIYSTSPRPVKEVAIIAALAFLAGVCGRAYNYSNSGLNLYLILVAQSGVGKEGMHSGISNICAALREVNPAAQTFVDFTEYASGQGLTKAIGVMSSFVNVSGEWGRRLQRMSSDDRPDSPMSTLRTVMTHLFQKSGKGMMVGGLGYSNTDQNVAGNTSVAYSMVGETTPGTFFGSLSQSMMEDGFLSRFIVMEYKGNRPKNNKNAGVPMQPELKQSINALCSQALNNNARNEVTEVEANDEAQKILDDYDEFCDKQIDGAGTNEAVRQMWNRAHLKAFKLAALLAVAENWVTPVITKVHTDWALNVVNRDIETMRSRMQSGDVGQADDYTRYQKAVAVLREYTAAQEIAASYGIPDNMKVEGVVPHRYIMARCSQISQFRNARQGSKVALDAALKALLDNGVLVEMNRDKIIERYAYTGRAYRVVALPKD